MSNTKHTQGPWKVKHSDSKTAFNVIGTRFGRKYKIARCPYLQQDDLHEILNKREKEEAEADARLIASAPSLLEALKECEDYFDNIADVDDGRPNKEMQLLAMIRETIKKSRIN